MVRDVVVADLLRSIRVRSSVFARPELRAPWGLTLLDEGPAFHIVTEGRCIVECDGTSEPIPLAAGDVVVLPRGGTHVMQDSPASPTVRLDQLLKERGRGTDGIFRAGGEGAKTVLVCGRMRFEDTAADLLLGVLPPVIHLKSDEHQLAPWLDATVTQARADAQADRPGADIVLARLADILFIQAIGAYLAQHAETDESGWLAAMRDPIIGEALTRIHLHPDEAWTVAALAQELGLSRSAFAARFTRLVGEPPLHYVTRVRLNAVAGRLRAGDEKVSTIATSFGYDSVSGLNKGFKARFGQTPGEYRRRFSAPTGV